MHPLTFNFTVSGIAHWFMCVCTGWCA